MIDREVLQRTLQGGDHKAAYAAAKTIAAEAAASDKYYACFDVFEELLTAQNAYVRTRAFRLCCAQARWDTEGKLQVALPVMLRLLQDEKPTVVRQCLQALHEVTLYRPELCQTLRAALSDMEPERYKESMAPLIRQDIEALLGAVR